MVPKIHNKKIQIIISHVLEIHDNHGSEIVRYYLGPREGRKLYVVLVLR